MITNTFKSKNKQAAFWGAFITLGLFLTACTEEIDITLDSTYARLVVFGEISSDTTTHNVFLSKSTDYFTPGQPQGVSNATVTLLWNGSSLILTENDTIPGLYQTPPDFYAMPYLTYRLQITNVDINQDGVKEEYVAESMSRAIGYVDSIAVRYWPSFKYVSVGVWAKDSITEDYYMMRLRKNGVMITDSLRQWTFTDDLAFNGNNTNGIDVIWLNQEHEKKKVNPGDTITLEVSSIPKDYFNFLMEAYIASGFQTPLFSQTPGNVTTNLSNGAVGFFAVIFTRRASTIAPEF